MDWGAFFAGFAAGAAVSAAVTYTITLRVSVSRQGDAVKQQHIAAGGDVVGKDKIVK